MKKLNILLILLLVVGILIIIFFVKDPQETVTQSTNQNHEEPNGEEQDTLVSYSGDTFNFSYPNYGQVDIEDGAYYFGSTTSGTYPGVKITSSTTGNFKDTFNAGGPAVLVAVAVVPIEQTTCLYRPFGEYEMLVAGVTDVPTTQGNIFKKQIIKTTNPSSTDPDTGYPTEGYRDSNEVEACVVIGSTFYHVTIKHSDLIDSTESAVVDSILRSFTF